VRAHARIRASGARLDLRSEPPLTLRRADSAVYIVGSAAGPLGGDDLHLDVEVTRGASLTVRSAAAAVHHPDPTGSSSRLVVDVNVGAGCHLDWQPEPSVFICGCDHRSLVRIHLSTTATMVWRDELVLGRHGELPGSVRSRLVVDRAGRPLLRNETVLGPRWPDASGPAGTDGGRTVGSLLVVGPEVVCPPTVDRAGRDLRAGWMALGPGAGLFAVVGRNADPIRDLLDRAVRALDGPDLQPSTTALPFIQLNPT
jgi:urease accessory protein